jgi:hypothetical protein
MKFMFCCQLHMQISSIWKNFWPELQHEEHTGEALPVYKLIHTDGHHGRGSVFVSHSHIIKMNNGEMKYLPRWDFPLRAERVHKRRKKIRHAVPGNTFAEGPRDMTLLAFPSSVFSQFTANGTSRSTTITYNQRSGIFVSKFIAVFNINLSWRHHITQEYTTPIITSKYLFWCVL